MAQVRVRKRGKTFSYIFDAGKVDGKLKVVENGGYPTKAEAYKAGVAAYNDFLHGNIGITSESISLKDFMTAWLDNVVKHNVKASSMQIYQTYVKNQIIPHLGEIKIQELTTAMLGKWIRDIQKAGLAYNTISSAHAFIHSVLNYTVCPAQLINSNPAAYIKVPKNAPRNVVKRHIITPERFKALLEKYPFGTPYYIPLLLLYHTGMRLGEVFGLSWSDIDFATKKITLRRQIRYIAKRGYFFTTLKTESSKRYIIVDDYLLDELARWQNQQAENEKQFGDSYVYVYKESDGHIQRQSKGLPPPVGEKISLLCTREDGQIVPHNRIISSLRKEGLNALSFRHTHATVLTEYGANPEGISGRLGHKNPQLTQNIYVYNTLKMQEDAAAIFDKILHKND